MGEMKNDIEASIQNFKDTKSKINFLLQLSRNADEKTKKFLNNRLEELYIQHYKENSDNPQRAIEFYASLGKKEAGRIAEMFKKYKDPSMASYILKKIGDYSGARKIWLELNIPQMVAMTYEDQAEVEENKRKRKEYFLKAAEIWRKTGDLEKAKRNYRKAGWIEFLKSKF